MAVRTPHAQTIFLQMLWVGWLMSAPASAANYYVNDASTTGDVAFPGCATMGTGSDVVTCGSCASPCQTLQYAYDQLALTAGDNVYLNTGQYFGSGATTPILDINNAGKAGTSTNFISFIGPADGRGRAALDGSNIPLALLDGQMSSGAGVRIQVNGIRLQSFGITHLSASNCGSTAQLCASGVRIMPPLLVTSFEMIGLDIYGLTGLQADALDVDQPNTSCLRCLVSNNHFHDSSGGSGEAMYIAGMSGIQIRDNEIRNWGSQDIAHAISLLGASNTVIENNVIQAVPAAAVNINICSGGACAGTGNNNVIIRNNTFRSNHTVVSGLAGAAGTIQVNTGTGHLIRNNIIHAQRYAAIHLNGSVGVSTDYNGFFLEGSAFIGRIDSTSYVTLANWQSIGNDSNSLLADPLYASATDSHLQSPAGRADAWGTLSFDATLSPFVDRGDPASSYSRERPPHGGRVDLGAYGNSPQSSLTPTLLQILSGQGQSATEGTALTAPFVVQLFYSTTSAPAVDVPVTFVALMGGGSTSPTVPVSDSLGRASAVATLGAAGPQSFGASIDAAGAGTATFTATALPASVPPPDPPDTSDAGLPQSPLFYRVSCQASADALSGTWMFLTVALLLRHLCSKK